MSTKLTELESHFAFGENWAQFATKIDQTRIEQAEKSLAHLVGREAIAGHSFLDIGSGSGLFSVAAWRLGCRHLLAIDIDPKCVETTRALLQSHVGQGDWECRCMSVFRLTPSALGTFDVVYAWGVLHHTGAMHKAISAAAELVSPEGMLVIALYRKTPFCGFWRVEKRLYSRSPSWVQRVIRSVWITRIRFRQALRGKTLREHIEDYRGRGMDFYHDLHDWLGGYPYESISPAEVEQYMRGLGFYLLRSFTHPVTFPTFGLFGSGCDEYCFARQAKGVVPIAKRMERT